MAKDDCHICESKVVGQGVLLFEIDGDTYQPGAPRVMHSTCFEKFFQEVFKQEQMTMFQVGIAPMSVILEELEDAIGN